MNLHEDAAFFQAAVNFTARETSFSSRLVEKDYFCSLLLALLARPGDTVVFKGGTCLAKVHAGFYRLSEDQDFVIPVALTASRSERRALSAPFKVIVAEFQKNLARSVWSSPWWGPTIRPSTSR